MSIKLILGVFVVKIKIVSYSDISSWVALSREYDRYILEVVPDLTEWYEGNGDSTISFDDYMESKISKNEVFMATDDESNCCGVIAISKANNRITFFGVSLSHGCNFYEVSDFLLVHALSELNTNAIITTNIVKSCAEPFRKEHEVLSKHNFTFSHDDLENGVPVSCMARKPQT